MACSQDGERPPAEDLQTEQKARALLSPEEKAKRRAETQRKYYLANKEAHRPMRNASNRRYYERHKEELNRYASERRRQERQLINAAKASLAEGRLLIELVPDHFKTLAVN